MSQPSPEGREIKRTRQACIKCRRKKTRCSGERPSCAHCTRLRQECEYPDQNVPNYRDGQTSVLDVDGHAADSRALNTELAARVALLESHLGIGTETLSASARGIASDTVRDGLSQLNNISNGSRSGTAPARTNAINKFGVVPPLAVLRSAADVYFANCQNQPYCYFNEVAFRQRLEGGSLPPYLLLAFMATVARYSSDQFFEERQFDAIETYARTAWADVLKQALSSDLGTDIHTVQATNMLAVIDFTAGKHRLGWVKIGLSVRFAQGLRLNAEPDALLPIWQQEEHRRIFWSVYLLDKLVSCGRSHPPTILDTDCTLRLPSSEENFRAQIAEEIPTLHVLQKLPDIAPCLKFDHFALTILAASILGRVVRHTLQQGTYLNFPPWDSRSDYAKMMSLLLSFESLLTTKDDDYASAIVLDFTTASGFDRQRAGHFVWSRGLYQLSHCFLTHPYLMRQSLKPYRDTYPRSYLRETSRRCQDSAGQLASILNTVSQTNCCAYGSFLGYLAVVASTIHQLYVHSKDSLERAAAEASRDACLEFLEHQPVRWEHYPRMATALREFSIDSQSAQALITQHPPDNESEITDPDKLCCMLDYAWLCDGNRSLAPFDAIPFPGAQNFGWGFFEDLIGDNGPFPELNNLQNIHSSKAGTGRGLWFNTSGSVTPNSRPFSYTTS